MPLPSRDAPRRPLRGGFSLIELLITITLVGLIALFTIPRFNKIVGEQHVSRAAQALANDMQMAVAIAQRDRKPIRIRWSADSAKLAITNRAMTNTYRQLLLSGSNNYSIRGSQVTMYPDNGIVEVYPNGLASDSISMTLTASTGYSKRVRMTRAGLVQVF